MWKYAQKANVHYIVHILCSIKLCNICYLFVFVEREKKMSLISLEIRMNYFDILNLLSYFDKAYLFLLFLHCLYRLLNSKYCVFDNVRINKFEVQSFIQSFQSYISKFEEKTNNTLMIWCTITITIALYDLDSCPFRGYSKRTFLFLQLIKSKTILVRSTIFLMLA